MLNGLSLFSGIGGFELALSGWIEPVAYCEIDPFCQAILLSRMADGLLPRAPIWPDIRTLPVRELPVIDCIYGGFPCQDLSVAGTGAGLAGSRSGLFFEIIRLARELRPRFIFLENVPALAVRGLDRVLLELTALGFDSRWTIVSAAEMGAPHLRERWFLLAHARGERRQQESRSSPCNEGQDAWKPKGQNHEPSGNGQGDGSQALANTTGIRRCERRAESAWIQGGSSAPSSGGEISNPVREGLSHGRSFRFGSSADARAFSEFERCGGSGWAIEPDVGRVAHGIPHRVDRLRGLGNAVVPQAAREAFMRLINPNYSTPTAGSYQQQENACRGPDQLR